MFSTLHAVAGPKIADKFYKEQDQDHKVARGYKLTIGLDAVVGVALVAIGLTALKFVGIAPSSGLILAGAGGGSLLYAGLKIATNKGKDNTKIVSKSLFRALALAAIPLGILGMTHVLPFPPQLTYTLLGAGGGYLLTDSLNILGNLVHIKQKKKTTRTNQSSWKALWV